MLQPGNYNGKIVAAETVLSAKKVPMVRIDFDVLYVNQEGNWVELGAPGKARVFLSTSADAAEYTKKKLEHLRFRGDYESLLFDVDWVELVCAHEDYKGKPQERWDLANWGGAKAQPASGDVLVKLSALWRAEHPEHVTPAGAPAAPPAQPAAPAAPPAEAPGEVPF